jgi:hypothetical protein
VDCRSSQLKIKKKNAVYGISKIILGKIALDSLDSGGYLNKKRKY